ncbi:hypothetical protein V6N11_055372, partial [Hibiscus sabdariffa]
DDKLNSEVINTSYNIVSDLVDISTGSWKYGVIEDLFEENIEVRIHSIPLSSLDLPDELIWRHDGAGVYTAKSGYRLLLDEHDIGSALFHSLGLPDALPSEDVSWKEWNRVVHDDVIASVPDTYIFVEAFLKE